MQQGRHLVNKGTGAAGTHAVHAFLQSAGKVDDLGILTAQLDGHIRLGVAALQRRGDGHHLLHERNVQRPTQIDGAGAGNRGPQGAVTQRRPGFLQQL